MFQNNNKNEGFFSFSFKSWELSFNHIVLTKGIPKENKKWAILNYGADPGNKVLGKNCLTS